MAKSGLRVYGGLECSLEKVSWWRGENEYGNEVWHEVRIESVRRSGMSPEKKDGVGTGGERAERARVEESLEKDG
jgi:hypothetical protein